MKTSKNSKSRTIKIAIAVICVLILAFCLIKNASGQASAMTSVNDADVIVESVEATEATSETIDETEATTEATEPETTEDEDDDKEVVYVYIPVETQPAETQPATQPTEDTEEDTKPTTPYEELPEATDPTEESEEEEEDDEQPSTTPTEEDKPSVHVHNFSIMWTKVNATCTAHGYTIYICDGCTETENRDFVEPIGHDYIVYKQEGYETHWCSNCGDTYQVEVETPAPAEETHPAETEPATEPATEPVAEEETAPAGHTCNPSDGHNHKEVKMGAFTYVYCEHVNEATVSADGRTKFFPYSWCL